MKKITILTLLLALSLSHCKVETEITPEVRKLTPQEQEALQCGMGFNLENIEVFDDAVIAEGDIFIERSQLTLQANNSGVQDRQSAVRNDHTADYNTITTIPVFLAVNENWRPLCLQAMANWTNLNGCKVTYVEALLPSLAETIIVSSDNTSQSLPDRLNEVRSWMNQGLDIAPAGAACFPYFVSNSSIPGIPGPSAWFPGKYIVLNNVAPLSNDERLRTAMHELGHTLGFHHPGPTFDGVTSINPCGGAGVYYYHLHGTPEIDPSSLMHGPVNANPVFNTDDIRAAEYLYPDGTPAIGNAIWLEPDETGKFADVKVTLASNRPKFYTYTVEVYAINSEGVIDTVDFNGDQLSCLVPKLRLGRTYRIRVTGHNYKGDFSATSVDYFLYP